MDVIYSQYMPAVGDSKRAIDEYYSEIMMGGHNILSLYAYTLRTKNLTCS
jgi:myo-inositol-1-phosphate synthase